MSTVDELVKKYQTMSGLDIVKDNAEDLLLRDYESVESCYDYSPDETLFFEDLWSAIKSGLKRKVKDPEEIYCDELLDPIYHKVVKDFDEIVKYYNVKMTQV